MKEPHPDLLLEMAVEAARNAGEHALRHWSRRGEVARQSDHDVTLRLDLECQAASGKTILRHFPKHAILGEENSRRNDSDYCWIVDPIDGSVNFSHGMAQWCSSVAVRRGEDLLAGAVFAPALDELYTATREGSACLNQAPIRVSDTRTMKEMLVRTGLCEHTTESQAARTAIGRLSSAAQKVRVMGAAALDICAVACGRADAYFEASIFIWDVAAAGLIAQRAGGRAAPLAFHDPLRMRYLASNGHLHDELERLLAGGL